ncbi:hypothetical protein NBRC116601_31570 [Cognatishimia sp. WU-CL00825]
MTCATNVQPSGKTWPGQLGAFDDAYIEGPPRAPSDYAETGAFAWSSAEVQQLRDDFIAAAVRRDANADPDPS